MISHKLKFIFIHIPKTSGCSMSLFLKDLVDCKVIIKDNIMGVNQGVHIYCEKRKTQHSIVHQDISYYKNIYGKTIDNYFKFTIVRNPYDRMLSFYFFYNGKDHKKFIKKDFIKLIEGKIFPLSIIKPQHKFIDNSFFIIHYENLIEELRNVKCLKGHVDFNDYPKLNCSFNSHVDHNKILDKELKDLIVGKYKDDFELFGYEV